MDSILSNDMIAKQGPNIKHQQTMGATNNNYLAYAKRI